MFLISKVIRICLKENFYREKKVRKTFFMQKNTKKVFLSLSSLCVIYPGGRSVRIKTKKVFFIFLFSVEALLEADPNEFDLGHIPFFS
jgi:hypothetical protein